MKLIKLYEMQIKNNNMIHLKNDDLEVSDEELEDLIHHDLEVDDDLILVM
jgi:hypothetical protein